MSINLPHLDHLDNAEWWVWVGSTPRIQQSNKTLELVAERMEADPPTKKERTLIKKALLNFRRFEEFDDNFTAQLYGLMNKADNDNFSLLAIAFPVEAVVYKCWFESTPIEKFYEFNKQYG